MFESNGLYNAYTFDFQNEPSSPLVSSHKRFGRSTESNIIASNDLGSFDGGYEVVNESLFDCLNLLWLAVYKHYINICLMICFIRMNVWPLGVTTPIKHHCQLLHSRELSHPKHNRFFLNTKTHTENPKLATLNLYFKFSCRRLFQFNFFTVLTCQKCKKEILDRLLLYIK